MDSLLHTPLDTPPLPTGGKAKRHVHFAILAEIGACEDYEDLEPMTRDDTEKAGYYYWTNHLPDPLEESVRAGIRDFCASRAERRRRGSRKRTAEEAELEQRADFGFPRMWISPPSPPPPRDEPSFFLFDH